MQREVRPQNRALVADIGGTNARFAIADLAALELSHISHDLCSKHGTFEEALLNYLSSLDERPDQAGIAIAAPVSGEEVRLTNSPWSFRKSDLRRLAGFEAVHVVNDFEALALSLPFLEPFELHQIGGTASEEHATKVVLGPGTGLGVAGLARSRAGWVAAPGEGGHVSLGAHDKEEFALLSKLRKTEGHVSAERAISGPGLANLYRVIAEDKGVSVPEMVDVVKWALAGTDTIAREALDLFAVWLGRFAGNIALVFGARGGVYIGGGIAPKIAEVLSAGPFREAFEDKGRMRDYLAPIPVYIILAPFATLKGVAVALREKLGTEAN